MPLHRRHRGAGSRRAIVGLGLVILLGLGTIAVANVLANPGADGERLTDLPLQPGRTPTVESVGIEGEDRPMRSTLPPQQMVIAGIPVTSEDGYIADGQELSPFDESVPAITNLDPDLLDALQQAATDASAEGIVMVVNSGWRSETYQQALLDEAVVTYGSEAEARKWVDTPEGSNHVKGTAVDIGPEEADTWLIENGSAYGLCQTYANEIWHFQLMTEPGGTCPPPVTDATEG